MCARAARCADRAPILKILIEFDSLEFDENSRRIRVDFVQKPRFNANEQLQACLLGLVQRRRKSRRGIMGRVMFFLLRMAFWLGVVCVLLPSGTKSTSPEAKIDATQAMTLAGAAVIRYARLLRTPARRLRGRRQGRRRDRPQGRGRRAHDLRIHHHQAQREVRAGRKDCSAKEAPAPRPRAR